MAQYSGVLASCSLFVVEPKETRPGSRLPDTRGAEKPHRVERERYIRILNELL